MIQIPFFNLVGCNPAHTDQRLRHDHAYLSPISALSPACLKGIASGFQAGLHPSPSWSADSARRFNWHLSRNQQDTGKKIEPPIWPRRLTGVSANIGLHENRLSSVSDSGIRQCCVQDGRMTDKQDDNLNLTIKGTVMKNKLLAAVLSLSMLAVAHISHADPLAIKTGDTMQKQIDAQKGKKITVRLMSGEELTGTVKGTTAELIQLTELSGKEFFDAVIEINKVTAILVRTK